MATRLFVDGIPSYFSENELRSLFLPYGTVLHTEVVRASSGRSLRFGFVEMATCQEAGRAMSGLNRSRVEQGKLIVVLAETPGRGHITERSDIRRQMA